MTMAPQPVNLHGVSTLQGASVTRSVITAVTFTAADVALNF